MQTLRNNTSDCLISITGSVWFVLIVHKSDLLPSACPAAASPFKLILRFRFFFFLSVIGEDGMWSFPKGGLVAPSMLESIKIIQKKRTEFCQKHFLHKICNYCDDKPKPKILQIIIFGLIILGIFKHIIVKLI